MKVLVSANVRVKQTPDGAFWTNNQSLRYDFWTRYLDVFDEVELLFRAEPVAGIEEGWSKVTGPQISGAPLVHHVGLKQMVRVLPTLWRQIREATRRADAVQCRLPCYIGSLVIRALPKGRPYGVEIVGDPYMSLSPGAYQHPLRAPLRTLSRRLLQREAKHAAVAGYVTEYTLQQHYPTDGFSTHFSSVALPETIFASAPRTYQPSDTRTVLTMGTLQNDVKGIDILIDALAPLPHVRLEILGDGVLRDKMQAQVASLGMSERVIFHGYTSSREEVFQRLDNADLFALVSRSEGLPRSVIEAMARALPAIGSRVGGIPELLPDATLIPSEDRHALTQLLQRTLADPHELEQMSARNLSKAREYSQPTLRQRRIQLYTALRGATATWQKQSG